MHLIGVEGIDGSGKTTLTASLVRALCARGITAAAHREPSSGAIGALFRRLSTQDDHDPHALALLSTADRCNQSAALLHPRAEAIVSDRYYLSGLAYHCVDGIDPHYYQQLNTGVRRPDVYLVLEVDPATAATRRGRAPTDRWESARIAEQVPAAYEHALQLVQETEGATVVRLNADQPPGAVLDAAVNAVHATLAPRMGGPRARTR